MMTSNLHIKDWSQAPRHACTATQIVTLLSKLEGWKLTGAAAAVAIEKTFHFKNYFETMAFVNAVALVAHQQDHHPDLLVFYNRCVVRFNTHDVDGLSSADFVCATLVDALLQ